MRYIDAEKTIEDIRLLAEKHCDNGDIVFANGVLKAVTRIKSQPTVDMVEVVRCGQCKYSVIHEKLGDRTCALRDGLYYANANRFCSDGIRRE